MTTLPPPKTPQINEYLFRSNLGDFRSQWGDGTASVKFDDGTSLDFTVFSGVFEISSDLTAHLTTSEAEADANWSDSRQRGKYQARGYIQPDTLALYLRVAEYFAREKATKWLGGKKWWRSHTGFYDAMTYNAPVLAKKLEDNVLEVTYN